MIKLIASDLDGTLLSEEGELTPFTKDMLDKAGKNGIVFIPCTARNYREIPEWILDNSYIPYVVSNNGAVITDNKTHKDIVQFSIEKEQAQEIMELVSEHSNYWTIGMKKGVYTKKALLEEKVDLALSSSYISYIVNNRTLVDEYDSLLKSEDVVLKIQLFVPPKSNTKSIMVSQLRQRFPSLNLTSSHIANIEIANSNASKGKALDYIMEALHIDSEQAMAFGDNLNDISLIEAVKYGYAVENAEEELKKRAYGITASNDKEGVAKILKSLFDHD